MPLYEYECTACGNRFEAIQKFSDPPLETCPKCGGAVRKMQSAPAFQFKGSGWYITDYAKKDAGGAGKGGGGTGADKSSGSDSGAAKTEKADSSTTSAAPATPAAKTKE